MIDLFFSLSFFLPLLFFLFSCLTLPGSWMVAASWASAVRGECGGRGTSSHSQQNRSGHQTDRASSCRARHWAWETPCYYAGTAARCVCMWACFIVLGDVRMSVKIQLLFTCLFVVDCFWQREREREKRKKER